MLQSQYTKQFRGLKPLANAVCMLHVWQVHGCFTGQLVATVIGNSHAWTKLQLHGARVRRQVNPRWRDEGEEGGCGQGKRDIDITGGTMGQWAAKF